MNLTEKLDAAEAQVRAKHPDADRLLDAIRSTDEAVPVQEPDSPDMGEALGKLCSHDALFATAMLRAVEVMASISPMEMLENPQEFLAAIWADGAVAGIEFQRTGGHQEVVA
jgi:hypothetical protein